LGAYLCFEDEAGQGLRPPKGRTWAPAGARLVVTVRGKGSGRANMAGVVPYRDGEPPHLFYKLHIDRSRKGEAKSFSWIDYRDLIVASHQHLGALLISCWDNLNVHLAGQLTDFATEKRRLATHRPATRLRAKLNPVEGVWSLLRRALANFAVADLPGLVRLVERKLKKIEYQPICSPAA
jgi:hypothetical protein